MRAVAVCLLLLLAASSGARSATSAQAPSIEATFGSLRTAAGCTAWRRIADLRLRGEYIADGLRYSFFEELDPRTGRYARRWRSVQAGIGGADGFNGSLAWVVDRSGAWHWLDGPHARAVAMTQAWLERRGWCDTALEGAAVQPRGAGEFRVTPVGGAPVEIWLDPTTHLVARTRVRLTEVTEIDEFARWSAVDGASVALERVAAFPEDATQERWTARSVASAGQIATNFEPPPQPRDVKMAGRAASSVPLSIENDKPLVGVRLNASSTLPYVLDTGGHFIVTAGTARGLGIRGLGGANSTGAGTNILRTSFAHVARVAIGGATMSNQIASVMNYSFRRLERGPRPPKAGWLGLETFERFAVTFDPLRQALSLRPLPATFTPAGSRVPIFFEEDAPLVACRIDGRPGECMIDTGNASDTIVESSWAKRTGLAPNRRTSVDEGDGWRAARATISFGPFTLRNEVVEYAPQAARGSESTTIVAAILSEDILRRYVTTFDYDRRAMWLEPIPGATARPYDRCGLGVTKQTDGSFVVSSLLAGSPASAAGLRIGERVVGVDGVPASALSAGDLYELNRGAVGSTRAYRVVEAPGRSRIVTLRLRELLP